MGHPPSPSGIGSPGFFTPHRLSSPVAPPVEGLGLCNWTLPPPGPPLASGRVETWYPLSSRIPNSSLQAALAPSPLSTSRTRNRTVSPALVLATPQTSRAFGKAGSQRYPVIWVLFR